LSGHAPPVAPQSPFRLDRRAAIGFVVAALAAFLTYANSLGGEFVWDDVALIVENEAVRSWGGLARSFTGDFFSGTASEVSYGYYRPVVTLSYRLDYLAWGLNPTGFHLTNVILHALNTFLVGMLLTALGLSWGPAMTTALIFAVHPVHSENVAWIAGRTDLLSFFWSALALVLVLHSLAEGRQPLAAAAWRAVAWMCFAVALSAKEMAVVLIPWLVVILLLCHGLRWRRALWLVAPFMAVLLVYLGVRFLALDVGTPAAPPEHTVLAVVLSAGPTVLRYLLWMLVPLRSSAYVVNPYVQDLADPRLLAALVLLTLLLGGLYAASRKQLAVGWRGASAATFGVMTLLSFAPLVSPFRPASPAGMGFTMAERFCYFPSFPFLAAVVLLAVAAADFVPPRHRARGRQVAVAAVALLVLTGALRTATRNLDWRDSQRFFSTEVTKAPDAALLWSHLAVSETLAGRMPEARRAVEEALRLGGEQHYSQSARVLWLTTSGDYESAIEVQEWLVRELNTEKRVARNNLAFLFLATGRLAEAQDLLEGLVASGEAYADVYLNLGRVYEAAGASERATEAYESALERLPDDVEAGLALARLKVAAGRLREARQLLSRLAAIHGADPAVSNNLALVMLRLGEVQASAARLEALVAEHPSFFPARVTLADLLSESGDVESAVEHLLRALEVAANEDEVRVSLERLGKLGVSPR
jgi:tetratricopeptide (TPR) repeat protein